MKHLNSNILAVVDCETSGCDPEQHDLLEVCILPLDKFMMPVLTNHLNLTLRPLQPENIDFEALRCQPNQDMFYAEHVCKSKERIVDVTLKGLDPYIGAEILVDWFEKLNLAPRKRIMPIAQNWCFDRSFLIKWLGPLTFDYIFSPCYRDTLSTSLFMNDFADYRGEVYPFSKNNLQYLCSTLNVERDRRHTALDDCVATAEVYRRMVRQFSGKTMSELHVVEEVPMSSEAT